MFLIKNSAFARHISIQIWSVKSALPLQILPTTSRANVAFSLVLLNYANMQFKTKAPK